MYLHMFCLYSLQAALLSFVLSRFDELKVNLTFMDRYVYPFTILWSEDYEEQFPTTTDNVLLSYSHPYACNEPVIDFQKRAFAPQMSPTTFPEPFTVVLNGFTIAMSRS